MAKYNLIITFFFTPLIIFAQWLPSSKRTSSLYAASYLNKDTFLVGTGQGNWASYDGGITYDSLIGLPQQGISNIIYKNRDTIFIVFRINKDIVKSTDGGLTWENQFLILNTGDTAFKKNGIAFIHFFDTSQGIIVGDTFNGNYQLFKTNDGGLTWVHKYNSELQNLNIRFFTNLTAQKGYNSYSNTTGTIKLTLNEKAILTISNFGQNWRVDSIKQADWTFRSAVFKDSINGIASIATANALVMAKTTDGGQNWELLTDSLKDNASASLRYVKGTSRFPAFYFAYGFKGAHVSYNDGESWQRLDTFRHDKVFFLDAETGISLANRFVSEPILYFNPEFVGLNEIHSKRNNQLLFYPNPASTAIQFAEVVQRVEIFDMQGKKWRREALTMEMDISSLPNGLYLVCATDKNGNSSTQKLVIAH